METLMYVVLILCMFVFGMGIAGSLLLLAYLVIAILSDYFRGFFKE